MDSKVYTHNPCGPLSKNHKIVIAAYQKGLTNIKVKKSDTALQGKGWELECDQIKWIRIYGDTRTVVAKINKWRFLIDGKLIC